MCRRLCAGMTFMPLLAAPTGDVNLRTCIYWIGFMRGGNHENRSVTFFLWIME